MLGLCWQGMLTAMAEQDQPGHSLAAALRQKAALVQDLLRGLEMGLQHKAAGVRSACYAFWHMPSVQCTLGRHLPGATLCFCPLLDPGLRVPGFSSLHFAASFHGLTRMLHSSASPLVLSSMCATCTGCLPHLDSSRTCRAPVVRLLVGDR